MGRLQRREILKLGLSFLGGLELSQLPQKIAAENSPRKRALLVGISNYHDKRWPQLAGAVNDVKIQEMLLIHRFGFAPQEIRLLVDEEATRDNILKSLEKHLVSWAQPSDVVVFHFSGHGSQVWDTQQIFPGGRVSTLVPFDALLPAGYPYQGGKVNDITGHTLWLLMQAINTENITFVFDSCYSGGARKGNLVVRSRPGDLELIRSDNPNIKLLASDAETKYQKKLLTQLQMTDKDLKEGRQKGVPKGIILAAAKPDQAAIDATFADTAAGLFTYNLSRYLWQHFQGEPTSTIIDNVTTTTQLMLQEYFPNAGILQEPEVNIQQGSKSNTQPLYFSPQQPQTAAEAVITKVQGSQVEVFLGGVNPLSLEAFGQGSILTVVDTGEQVEIETRQGFFAQGRLRKNQSTIIPGTILQEYSRAIPNNLTLRLGLGRDLEAAKPYLEAIGRVELVSVNDSQAHYLFARITPEYAQQLENLPLGQKPIEGSIALFTSAGDLLPDSAGTQGETVADAVTRLSPKIKSLLAARLVKLTLNTNSTRLRVAAAMETVAGSQLIAESFTLRQSTPLSLSQQRGVRGLTNQGGKIPLGTDIKFIIQSQETFSLYLCVLLISVGGELSVLAPSQGNEDFLKIAPQESIYIPDLNRGDKYRLEIRGILGWAEVLILTSAKPLTKAIALLKTLAAERGEATRGTPVGLSQPDEVIFGLLDDLDGNSRGDKVATKGIYQVNAQEIAAMSISFRVVET